MSGLAVVRQNESGRSRRLSLEGYKADFLSRHKQQLAETRNRLDGIPPLSDNDKFLAYTGFEDLDEAISNTKILKKNKRAILLSVGNVALVLGKYGVATYAIPTGIKVDCLSWSLEFVGRDVQQALHDKIGSVEEGWEGFDRVMNYSSCS